MWTIQLLAGLAVIGLGGYLAATGKPTIGTIVAGVGISLFPFAVAGLIGAAVCLIAAGVGWYLGKLIWFVALLVIVLSFVTITDRVRKLR